jgi:C4-dicarboxylate transporter/malic acid transport protein
MQDIAGLDSGRPEPHRPYKTPITNGKEVHNESLRTGREMLRQRHIGLRDLLEHFTWAWFITTMSTGGVALLLYETPHRFNGLTALGDAVFLLDLVLFFTFCACITTRFLVFPNSFLTSLRNPAESFFFPAFWISVINILSCTQVYGVPRTGAWLITTLRVLFWISTACAFLVAVGQCLLFFSGKLLTMRSLKPAVVMPAFPILLSGTLASLVASSQPPEYALPILVAGITSVGLGILVASYLYVLYIGYLIEYGLPPPNVRPGLFIAVGPPSFTALALLGISQKFAEIFPSYTVISGVSHPDIIADIVIVVALCTAVFFWATAFWNFFIALMSVLHGACTKPGMSFDLVWWALVFPNIGLTIATIKIGQEFRSEGILWICSAMTIILVAVWLAVGAAHVRALWKKQILWPMNYEARNQ